MANWKTIMSLNEYYATLNDFKKKIELIQHAIQMATKENIIDADVMHYSFGEYSLIRHYKVGKR